MVLSLGYDKAYCWNCSIPGTHTFIFFEEKNGEKHSVFLHYLYSIYLITYYLSASNTASILTFSDSIPPPAKYQTSGSK